jgi:hypothetical protein
LLALLSVLSSHAQMQASSGASLSSQQTSRKRRRSSKKIPPVQLQVDSAVLSLDWSRIADLLTQQLASQDKQQTSEWSGKDKTPPCSKP